MQLDAYDEDAKMSTENILIVILAYMFFFSLITTSLIQLFPFVFIQKYWSSAGQLFA